MVPGVLTSFDTIRAKILEDVINTTAAEFSGENLVRGGKLSVAYFMTYRRRKRDLKLWSQVRADLRKNQADADRSQVMRKIISHYAQEIGGHFDPKVYKFATHIIPLSFNWLLNAASVRQFLPWKQTQTLEKHLKILGEVPSIQKLAEKGTVLLVPTHQSNIDSMLIGYVIHLMRLPPFAYGAGLNLFTNPALNFLMSNLGAYTVDRQKGNSVYKAVLKNYSTRILEEGVHSIFFPGGGRCRSGAIENKLKLGLLGTALHAQLENLQAKKEKPLIFIVPMVMSYHFVLEASSLVDDYLAHVGKQKFYGVDSEEPWPLIKTIKFLWKFFSDRGAFIVRLGKPLDVFGNQVDDEGRSIGPNNTVIDPVKWLTTAGKLQADAQRDREYVQRLGSKIVERFHKDNTVLASHLVAFAFFMSLRKKYPDLDLYRFLRLSAAQRSLPFDVFLKEASYWFDRVRELAHQGELHLSEELLSLNLEDWVKDGIRNLGVMHDVAVMKIAEDAVATDDLPLLYYYRNRLTGYGLTLQIDGKEEGFPGEYDEKGFLV